MSTFAAVDIGANSVRLKIARWEHGMLNIIHEDRQVTRLGEQVFKDGILSPEAMADTIKALRRFHRTAQKYAVRTVRVVGTSALREARNRETFCDWVSTTTGWQVEVISGIEEARLIHLGIVSNLKIRLWPVLLVDLGGGSCELTISSRGRIRETVSLPLGAVRLTDEFLRKDPPRKKELERLSGFIGRELGRVAKRIAAARVRTVIATSGTAAALAAVAAVRYRSSRGEDQVSASMARRLARMLSRRTIQQRRAFPGIGPRRAEIIVAGALVFAELLERCRLGGFRFSPLGLRDGLLAQMAAEHDRGARSRRRIESERWQSILASARHYNVELEHATAVRRFAQQLFRSLKQLHQLPGDYEEWISAAAMLYEVGAYINRNGRYRHTWYIVSHSEILGYTPQQRAVIAAIARYVGKSRPSSSDAPLKAVAAAERANIMKACLVLRLARALSLGRNNAVTALRLQLRPTRLTLRVKPKRGATAELEIWAAEKEGRYFREAFGRELVVEAA